jgi:hypothetical protein
MKPHLITYFLLHFHNYVTFITVPTIVTCDTKTTPAERSRKYREKQKRKKLKKIHDNLLQTMPNDSIVDQNYNDIDNISKNSTPRVRTHRNKNIAKKMIRLANMKKNKKTQVMKKK